LTEEDVESAFEALTEEARNLMQKPVVIDRAIDAKYAGQSFELTIQLPGPRAPVAAIAEAFAREHERTYGHRADADPVQIVNVRIIARIPRERFFASAMPSNNSSLSACVGGNTRNAYFGQQHGVRATPLLSRFELDREEPRRGPLLIDEYDATTLVPPGCSARLDHFNNILIRIEA
jgi:N-methylhydantoinase A